MKIIKYGVLEKPKVKRILRFTCKNCGCIFEANNSEYENCWNQRDGVWSEINCPCCNKVVILARGGE